MILTQAHGIIMGPVSKLLGFIFNAIYNFFYSVGGIESIALSIVVFTIFVRLILLPFTVKMTRSSKIQQFLKPEFNKINKKYKGKKDQESMLAQQKETRELQEKYGIKMTSGCITSIIQFPIFIGLYNVIQNVPAYVGRIREFYDPIANAIYETDNGYTLLNTFVEDNNIKRLAIKLSDFANGDAFKTGAESINAIIDVLNRCTGDLFTTLSDKFASNPAVVQAINENSAAILRTNSFIFGINLSEAPGFRLTPALIIPILSALCQVLSMIVQPMNETGDPQQDQQMQAMRRSMYFMPIMSFIVTINAPAGLGVYWATSAFIGFLITFLSNLYYDHVDMEKIVEKQRAKAEVALEKKRKSGKKTFMDRFNESLYGTSENQEAVQQQKGIKQYSNYNLKNYGKDSSGSESDEATSTDSEVKSTPQKGSIADRANAVKRFNDEGV